ncbi:TrmB family transcriptional regulator [Haloprofundus halophilus]|uniref:TrmB family transcriptional regulator n=1 Tax=Haloprofundus halophilus TaxID=2283527 RepID=UPI000E43842B|nr:helix-turn-helix domain-containing protein [Haloprofundus halophilus]
MTDDRPDERDVEEALERLGLSNYEARVFVALHRLGTGTAKDVHDLAGVPRSQVYGAAEDLEARGLVELQQSTPKRYRPVSLEAAKELLTVRLERERDRAFDALAELRSEEHGEETRDDVWTVRGRRPIDDRTVDLVRRAERRILFGADSVDLLDDDVVVALRERADAGVDVDVVSASAAVREVFARDDAVDVAAPPADAPGDFTGRVVLADDDIFLLSVLYEGEGTEPPEETAIWSAGTAMAAVLTRAAGSGIEALVGRADSDS